MHAIVQRSVRSHRGPLGSQEPGGGAQGIMACMLMWSLLQEIVRLLDGTCKGVAEDLGWTLRFADGRPTRASRFRHEGITTASLG